MSKISGPLLDRIDIHVEVPAAEYKELASTTPGTSSAEIREQVIIARKAQAKRFPDSKIRYNGQMTSRQIREFCKLDSECMNLMKVSVNIALRSTVAASRDTLNRSNAQSNSTTRRVTGRGPKRKATLKASASLAEATDPTLKKTTRPK
jgi:predicted ATPase with chaperone activity